MGTASENDNSRVLDKTAMAVSNFRVSGSSETSEESFTIRNIGGSPLTVSSVTKTQDWLSLGDGSAAPFDLREGESREITVGVDWSLAGNVSYTDSIKIVSNDPDQGTSIVSVTAMPPSSADVRPALSVLPFFWEISAAGGTVSFSVDNIGEGFMGWEAASDSSWLTLRDGSSGSGSGTITVDAENNSSNESRTGIISVSAPNAANSLVEVKVNQAGLIQHDAGDVDGNQTADLRDVILSLRVLAGDKNVASMIRNDFIGSAADLNSDGKIGTEEAVHVLQFLASQ
jgi:hypothetical protein